VNLPERIVPDATEPGIVALHVRRYEFARPYCRGRDVLDAGCGVGYGAALLAEVARRVVAVDRDEDAIAYARRRYGQPNIEFVVGDLVSLEQPDGAFDVVCAFETIEHLIAPERFVGEARRVLRPDGAFIVSTPRVDETTVAPTNPFHEREYSCADFERVLGGAFRSVEMFGQRRVETLRHRALRRLDVFGLRRRVPALRRASRSITGTAAMEHVTSEGLLISSEHVEDATELVAVCRP
jgi:SAM-dependent methyltransferase